MKTSGSDRRNPASKAVHGHEWGQVGKRAAHHHRTGPRPRQRSRGRRPMPGLPGWSGIVLSLLATAAAGAADLATTDTIGVLFGLCLVLISLGVAAAIRPSAMFAAAVLPPLSTLTTLVGIGLVAPDELAGDTSDGAAGFVRAVVGGLATSVWFLLAACAVTLGTVALRSAR